jgi:hypothetical protein
MNNKSFLIFFLVLLTLVFYIKYQEYERYLLDPYISIFARDGLNNKIRVMLAYLYVANVENKKLRIIWIKDEQCPDNFDNLFEPINNIEFIYTETIPKDIIDYNIGWTPEDRYLKNNYYKYLKPVKSIQNDIDNIKNLLKNDYISCHIRRTDIVTLKNYFGSHFNMNLDTEYITFIDQYPKNLNIYIATDNQDTQQKFIDIYGDRIIYKKIDKTNNLRQTSLQDAVKDMYVCAGAKYFMGSPWSSFTDSINEIRKLNE